MTTASHQPVLIDVVEQRRKPRLDPVPKAFPPCPPSRLTEPEAWAAWCAEDRLAEVREQTAFGNGLGADGRYIGEPLGDDS